MIPVSSIIRRILIGAIGPVSRPLRRTCTIFAVALSLASPALAEKHEVVMLGDSLTQGYGLPPEQGLVPQLQAWLDREGVPAQLVNAGVSGDTTAGGLSRVDWSLTPQTRALVVILGGNDMLRGIDPGVARTNLDQILTRADAHGLPVLLVALRAPANYGPAYKRDFEAIYPELAHAHGAMLADHFFLPIAGPSGDPALAPELMQPDGIHPAAAGVANVVDWLGPQLRELLKRID